MAVNVLIFGMAHSGKSTLMGYLIVKARKLDIDKLSKEFQRNYGKDYDSSQDYAYIVNTYKNEIIKSDNGSGSTKSNHIKRVEIDGHSINIIDTPGVEHRDRERTKGMFYSDIGVFCIEINQIIENRFFSENRLDKIIPQLILWSHFKKDRIIILLTKSDLVDYCKDKYDEAVEIISALCNEMNLKAKIIPISVNVPSRHGHNIYNRSSKMPWCESESFYHILKKEIASCVQQNNKQLLFHIDRQYKKTQSYSGKSWRIKIITGSLHKGDKIILAPVKIGNNEGAVYCKVKTIRYDINKDEKILELDHADAGNFVGIDIQELRLFNKKSLSKNDFNAQYTTCGFSCENEYIIAKYSIIEIEKSFSRFFVVNKQMSIMWFGRAVTAKILKCEHKENGVWITFEFISRSVALPFIDNKLCLDFVIIDTHYQKYDESLNAQKRFIDGKLIKLMDEIPVDYLQGGS